MKNENNYSVIKRISKHNTLVRERLGEKQEAGFLEH